MRSSPKWPHLLTLVLLVAVGCGGGSAHSGQSDPFAPEGKKVFEQSLDISGSDGEITDPFTGAMVDASAGTMTDGAAVRLTVWSGQRSVAHRSGFTSSVGAFDLTLVPAQIAESKTLTVKLPWRGAAASKRATMIVAFGAHQRSIVLRDALGSDAGNPTAIIGSREFAYLADVSEGSNIPTTIGLAVEEAKADSAKAEKPTLRLVWAKPESRTSYAGKRRIAITIHGILNSSLDLADVTSLFGGKFAQEGTEDQSKAFDEVFAFDYAWRLPIEDNGEALAQFINSKYGDPTKYEVHLFAHSMGGLVSRYAVEKVGTPSVTQIVTLGTPHKGVPLTILKNVSWTLDGVLSLLSPGVVELLDDSSLIADLQGSAAAQVEYDAVAGTSHADFYNGLGDVIEAIYSIEHLGHIDHDGIVPAYSALGGPAKTVASVSDNHSQLVSEIVRYWPGVGGWVTGMNRRVGELRTKESSVTLAIKDTDTLTANAYDKDGDMLDPTLLDRNFLKGVPVSWESADSSIAKVDARGVVTGVANGQTTVTATTAEGVETTTGHPVSVSIPVIVGPRAYTITFSRPSLGPGDAGDTAVFYDAKTGYEIQEIGPSPYDPLRGTIDLSYVVGTARISGGNQILVHFLGEGNAYHSGKNYQGQISLGNGLKGPGGESALTITYQAVRWNSGYDFDPNLQILLTFR